MSKRTINLILILILSTYLLILAQNGKLSYYLSSRYYGLSHATSILAFGASLVGSIYSLLVDFKKGKISRFLNSQKYNFKDLKFYLFIIFVVQVALIFYMQLRSEGATSTSRLLINNFENLISVLTSPILVLIIGLALIVPWKKNSVDQKFLKFNFANLFVFITLFLALALPQKILSELVFSQRVGSTNNFVGVNGSLDSVIDKFSGNTEQYEIGDWIRAINFEGDITKFVDKKVSVTGFITKPRNTSENVFMVSRFAISCCVLDATPVGLLFETELSDEFKTDDWINVKGIFIIKSIQGRDQLVIIPETIEATEIPDKPYIS